MANTIIQLTDTPGSYSLSANKFLRVNNDANATEFWDIVLDYLGDVQTTGAYAPSTGQTLVFSADSKWRPSTLDIYSAGNGLNKSGLTLNVTAGASGGLLSNSSGVFIDDVSGLTAGIYGNATHVPVVTVNSKGQITTVTPTLITATQATTITNSFVGNVVGTSGQITVTGGTGNNSNATLTLPSTGVTAATYGNATAIPQITVDTYGRIQNVDLVTVSGASGSGNVTEAYKTITVAGQTSLNADTAEDTLTIVGAGGIEITTNAGTDTLTFTGNSTVIVSAEGVGTLSDVYSTGVANGESLIYVSANSRFEPGTPVTNLADSGVGAGTYGNGAVSARITVNTKGQITSATEVAIPQGDITSVVAGGGLTGGGTSGDVTLNIAQSGVVAGTYGNASVYPIITVDAYGRLTTVTTGTDSGASGGSGDITSVVAGTGLSGGATSGDATLNVSGLTVAEIAAGSLQLGSESFSDNDTSLMTSAAIQDKIEAYGYSTTTGDITSVVAGTGLTGGATSGSATLNLGTSGATAGTYGNASYTPQVTVDTYGRVTGVTNVASAGGGIALTDLSVATASASGGGALVYNNSTGVTTFTPPDLSSYLTSQTDSQDMTISGNVISLTGQTGNVDLTSTLASVAGNYADANVAIYLSNQGFANQSTIIAAITDSAPTTLDTLNELAAALGDDANFATSTSTSLANRVRFDVNNQGLSATDKSNASTNLGLHTVSTSGLHNDLGSRPTLTLVGTDLTYDGTTVSLSSLSGDITAVVAGTGLTGGATSGSATLNVSGLTVSELAAGSLQLGSESFVDNDTSLMTSAAIQDKILSYGYTTESGDITGVTAGSGLSGGGTSGSVTLSLDAISLLELSDVGSEGTNGQVLTTDGAGSYTFTTPMGSGDITSVVAGTGLTGGATSGAATLNVSGLTVSELAAGSLQLGSESFADNDTSLMTSAAIQDKIEAYGYTTESGDITGVTAGTGLTGGGASGTVTLNVSGLTIAEIAASSLQLGSESFSDDDTSLMTSAAIQDKIEAYGYSTTVGDITGVTAGSGLAGGGTSGGLTLSLETSGATAGTYGNATYTPQVTVDTYGRVTSVTNVAISGGGGGDITGVNITAGTGLSGTVTTTTGQHTQTLAVSGLTVAEIAAGSLQLGSESFTDNDTSLMTSAAIQDKILSYGYTTESGDITSVVAGTGLTGGATTGAATLNVGAGTGITVNADDIGLTATAVTAGTYGNASYTPQFTVNSTGQITGVTNVSISGGSASDTFKTISVSGQSDVVADSSTDTLTFVAGTGMTITTNAGSDQITLASSGGGGSGATIQRFKLNYDSSGNLDSTSDLTSLIDSVSIDSSSGGDCTINFDSSINYPPASIMIYGYDYTNNKYSLVPLETTMALREIAGGGSSGSPTLFNGSSSIALKLRLRETETGASRSFGVTTHAWIEFVVYD